MKMMQDELIYEGEKYVFLTKKCMMIDEIQLKQII
jgi:hypothetical protein